MGGDGLEAAVERTGLAADDPLLGVLTAAGVHTSSLEASLRGGDGPMRGGRVMVERQTPATARAFIAAADLRSVHAAPLIELAEAWSLPLILGWDLGVERCIKLYLNASDTPDATRASLRSAIVPGVREGPPAPHVFGLNLGAAEELKLYGQHRMLPADAPRPLMTLAERAADAGVHAGAITSFRVRGEAAERKATFLALRGGKASAALTSDLPGWNDADAARLAPFEAGEVSSVGFAEDGRTWTVYFKPHSGRHFGGELEPFCVFSDGETELALHLEPAPHAPRHYAIVGEQALSYRVRRGTLAEGTVHALMSWVVRRLADAGCRASELGDDGLRTRDTLVDPPPPWHVVPRSDSK